MKKTHRAVLSILLVLTLLTALPLTAMAEDLGNNTSANEHPIVGNSDSLTNNTGTVTENSGTITNNGVPADTNTNYNPTSGTVEINRYDGKIENNYGTVELNDGTNSGSPTINNNYGLVKENDSYGKVITNQSGGIIQENSGVVGDKDQSNTGNFGTVGTNNQGGVVYNNAQDGKGGEVVNNYGSVHNIGGTVVNNEANGNVIRNANGSIVVNNNAGGTVQYNEAGGTVKYNHGTVGTGGQGGNGNLGTVEYNYIDGVVYNIEDRGEKGTVTTNFGTVHQYNSTTDGTTTTSTTTTFYGLQAVDDEENGAQYYLGSYASNSGEAIDLESKLTDIKRDGYKLVSYTPYTYNKDSNSDDHLEPQTSGNPIFVGKENDTDSNSTSYYITAPTLLKLTWEKIASIFKPAASSGGGGGAEAVELSARKRYIGLGSVIFINEKGYKVVEIKDDAYVVVSFDALPDEDVQDLDALYAKLFTPEQQKLIKNVGQLLDSEDVLAVFGTPGNHPVYEISKDLVK